MLLQFTVGNFLSFDSEESLNLTAALPLQDHPDHVVEFDLNKGAALRATAIYGPNGSGKSNLIKAMSFARDLIVFGTRPNDPIDARPFKLRSECGQKPSSFEFVLRTDGVIFHYGFRSDQRRIWEEWLYATYEKKEVLLFERTTGADNQVSVKIGQALISRTAQGSQFLKFVASGTRYNQLFLTEAAERNISAIDRAFGWFRDVLTLLPADVPIGAAFLPRLQTADRFSDFRDAFIAGADTGITHFITDKVKVDMDDLLSSFPENRRSEYRTGILQLEPDMIGSMVAPNGEPYVLGLNKDASVMRYLTSFGHKGADDTSIPFSIFEESDGTQRLIKLAPIIFKLRTGELLPNGSESVVVLDELDRGFHTLLSRYILQQALERDPTNHSSQFIFTTHDTRLLDLEILRRDEIWFVDKDNFGASHFSSLADFKVRPDLKVDRGYLNGRFGAIPTIARNSKSMQVDQSPFVESDPNGLAAASGSKG